MKMIGWWPSFRVTVADKPNIYHALNSLAIASEAHGREVMALVHDDVTVVGDEVSYNAIVDLSSGPGSDIDVPVNLLPSAVDAGSISFGGISRKV